jgi:hypothetical protein
LNPLQRHAGQLAEDARPRHLDHDLVAVDLDKLTVATVTPQVRSDLLDHRLDDLDALGLSACRFFGLFCLSQHDLRFSPWRDSQRIRRDCLLERLKGGCFRLMLQPLPSVAMCPVVSSGR